MGGSFEAEFLPAPENNPSCLSPVQSVYGITKCLLLIATVPSLGRGDCDSRGPLSTPSSSNNLLHGFSTSLVSLMGWKEAEILLKNTPPRQEA